MGWGGSEFFLAESQSRLYPHMRAKFGHDPTAVSKKVPFNFISRWQPLDRSRLASDIEVGTDVNYFISYNSRGLTKYVTTHC